MSSFPMNNNHNAGKHGNEVVDVVRINRNTVIRNAVRKADRKIRVQSHSDIPEKVVFGDLILVATSVGILIINNATASTILAAVTSGFNRMTGYPVSRN